MKCNRRDFLAAAGLSLLTASAGAEIKFLQKLKPDLKKLKSKVFSGSGNFTFAAINDLHMLDAKSTSLLNRAVLQIKADESIKFVTVLGDVASDGRLEEFRLAKQCLDKLEKPYFCIPGNHDCTPGTSDPYANFRSVFGNTQWEYSDEGWLVIGLDTSAPGQVDGIVSPERLDWLKEVIRHTAKSRPIALMAHHPFNPSTKGKRVSNADEVLGLFSGMNLKLVAGGHYHGNQAEVKDGILFLTTACCASSRDNHDGTKEKGYRRFTIAKEAIEHQFVPVNE